MLFVIKSITSIIPASCSPASDTQRQNARVYIVRKYVYFCAYLYSIHTYIDSFTLCGIFSVEYKVMCDIYIQGRAKVNLQPLLDVEGNTGTHDEENAEILNAFFASVFNSVTSCSLSAQVLELEGRDREHNEVPIIQTEMM